METHSFLPQAHLRQRRPLKSSPTQEWLEEQQPQAREEFYQEGLKRGAQIEIDFDSSPHCVGKVILEATPKILQQETLHSIYRIGGAKAVAKVLRTDLEEGIHGNEDDTNRRKMVFGSNVYKNLPTRSFFFFTLKAFKDSKILFLLVYYGVFSLAFGFNNHGLKEGLYDGGSIFFAISLIVTVNAASNFCSYRELLMLSDMSSNININVEVVRGGMHQRISIFNVVVGDVSCMTEEYRNVDINIPFLSSGVKVVGGFAYMLVTSVGTNTSRGKMMSSSCGDFDEKTPLQARLVKLTSWLRWIVLTIALLILLVMLVRYWMQSQEIDGNKKEKKEVIKSAVRIFTAAITIPVMVIPEGWAIIIPLTCAYLRRTVMGDCALFRNLSALETMGTVTTICTEKTGMLTSREMMVTKFCIGEEVLTGDISIIHSKVLSLLHQAVGLNSTCSIYNLSSTSPPQFFGSPTERAILHWATSELGMDMENLKQMYTIPNIKFFNANRKRSGVLLREKNHNFSYDHVHWKGAAEIILSMCSHYYTTNGSSYPIHQQTRRRFEETIQGMAAHPLRCIAFAHSTVNINIQKERANIEESGLTLLALVGLKESCRPGVRMAVEAFRFAGVDVNMITGDDAFTAKAIATECGILRTDQDLLGAIVLGEDFSKYSPELRMEMVDRIRVMARSSPSEKSLMGTVVVKENSDIVIMDDNFTSFETILQCGRCIYNNAHNFLQFQLTVMVVTLVVNCITAISTYKIPISEVQVLWESLIVDTLGAVALASERPTQELMVKGPVSLEEPLVTKIMWRNLVSQALFQIMLLLRLQFKGQFIFHLDGDVNDTLIFNTSVLCQVFNLFNSRNLEKKNVFEGIQDCRLFLWMVGMIVSLQVLMVELLNRFVGTERLDWGLWAASVGMASTSWLIALVVKWIPMPHVTVNSFVTKTQRRREWTHMV
ncbi:hypothetical protein MRB53_011453 [Persea americana]|uniref:Uncharacterized protein n=1 Tax=Persea americana TaxID=3435 RepID=A0ACC2LV11_PERAE|nr:hypothetical protein MRB53_011453 [Persea americana]